LSLSASRIAGVGLATAAIVIAVLAALLFSEVEKESELSRQMIAVQEVKDGIESLKDGLQRLSLALAVRGGGADAALAQDLARERVGIEADLDYLRAKAAEQPRFAPALAAVEGPARDFLDAAALAGRSPGTVGATALGTQEESLAAVRRAMAVVTGEIHARTLAQIRLAEGRRVTVKWLLVGTIVVLVGLVVAFVQSQRRARADRVRIEQLAHFDRLTGLPNRSLLDDRLEHALQLARRQGEPLAVLLFDLDGFKAVNDTLGHAAGDALLAQVGERARECMRASDTVGRLGGDEFLAILPATGPEGARAVAGKLLEALSRPYALARGTAVVGVSIGGAFHPVDGEVPDALTHAADVALYRAKREGRNRYIESAPGEEPGLRAEVVQAA
jgi:diguanylate cyclase (GGDEF)-like protein